MHFHPCNSVLLPQNACSILLYRIFLSSLFLYLVPLGTTRREHSLTSCPLKLHTLSDVQPSRGLCKAKNLPNQVLYLVVYPQETRKIIKRIVTSCHVWTAPQHGIQKPKSGSQNMINISTCNLAGTSKGATILKDFLYIFTHNMTEKNT